MLGDLSDLDYGAFRDLLRQGNVLGVDAFAVSVLPFLFNGKRWTERATLGETLKAWEIQSELSDRYPDQLMEYAVATAASMAEGTARLREVLDRERVIGVKLDLVPRVDDVVWEPVFDLAAQRQLPVLVHCSKRLSDPVEGETEPEHLAGIAGRYPEVNFILAHLGMDWTWTRRVVADLPNVFLDTSGCMAMANTPEDVVRFVGADRVIFGSDVMGRSLGDQLGRVTGSQLSGDDQRKILSDNFLSLVQIGHKP